MENQNDELVDDVSDDTKDIEGTDGENKDENPKETVSDFETRTFERDLGIIQEDGTVFLKIAESDPEYATKLAKQLGYTLEKAKATIEAQMEEDPKKAEKKLSDLDRQEKLEAEAESKMIVKYAKKQLSEYDDKAIETFDRLTKGRILSEEEADEIVDLVMSKYSKDSDTKPKARASLNTP